MSIDIDFVNDENIDKLNFNIINMLENLKSYDQWEKEKEKIKERLFMAYNIN